jgi:hypothetical protein
MKEAMLSCVPKGTEELNLKAFTAGFDYGMDIKKKKVEEKAETVKDG